MAKKIVEMLIESVVMELPDTKTIRLRWPEDYDVPFKTGQFITLYWPDSPKYKRAYSLSSCALDQGYFEVTVKRDGKMGTRIVDWAKEGDTIMVIPPTGRFLPVLEADKHLICIAGGSGVTPFRGFVREATRTGATTKITVLYSVRTTEDIIFNEEFRELENENPHFNFLVTCTRLPEEDPWTGRRGRIDTEWINAQVGDLANTVFYACGPTALVENTEALVRDQMGLPKEQLRLEKWGERSLLEWDNPVGVETIVKRTALFEIHRESGAKLAPFGGWEMPIQYSSIIDEHMAVRQASGIFDISHMGEILFQGSDALAFINELLTNDAALLEIGDGQYSLLCNEQGGVIDDLYVFRLDELSYLWVVNASRVEAVTEWLETMRAQSASCDVVIENLSDRWSAVAVQGPRVVDFVDDCVSRGATGGRDVPCPTALAKHQIAQFQFAGEPVWVSRTGYTGEDGFELITTSDKIGELWRTLRAEGHKGCLQPAGLGARDTLRTEMGYPLFGHELSESISPLEAGLGFFVKLGKASFTGRSVLQRQKEEGLSRVSVAFAMVGKAPPPRAEYPVYFGSTKVGMTTSGAVSPSLKTGIGMALVDPEAKKHGSELTIEIRGRQYPAVVKKKPLYQPKTSQS